MNKSIEVGIAIIIGLLVSIFFMQWHQISQTNELLLANLKIQHRFEDIKSLSIDIDDRTKVLLIRTSNMESDIIRMRNKNSPCGN